jgi:Flp pilus assembly protein TadG
MPRAIRRPCALWRIPVRVQSGVCRPARRCRRRHGSSRGQSLVEFALVIPIFCALLFGTLEMGLYFKSSAAYQEAALEAARVAATAGGTDQQALTELRTTLASENPNSITAVTIYDATLTTGVPVTATMSTVYTFSPSSGFTCIATCTGGWANLANRSTTAGALDRIGVQVQYVYTSLTGILPPQHVTQTATALMEPTTYGP